MNQPSVRITLDLPVSLNEAIIKAVKETSHSKASYIRMALETLNMIVENKQYDLFLDTGKDCTISKIFIPGVHK